MKSLWTLVCGIGLVLASVTPALAEAGRELTISVLEVEEGLADADAVLRQHQRGGSRQLVGGNVAADLAGDYWLIIHSPEGWPPGGQSYLRLRGARQSSIEYWWGSSGPSVQNPDETREAGRLWYRYEMFILEHSMESSDFLMLRGTGGLDGSTKVELRDFVKQLDRTLRDYLWIGTLFGAILSLILFHAFIVWQLRDRVTLVYVGLVAVGSLTEFSSLGVLSQWLFPVSERFVAFCSLLTGGIAFLYTRMAMGNDAPAELARVGGRTFWMAWVALLFGVFFVPTAYVSSTVFCYYLFAAGLAVGSCLESGRLGSKVAVILCFGWLVAIVAIVAHVGAAVVSDIRVPSKLTWFAWAIGVQVLIFACVMPVRIRELQRERDVLSGRIEEQLSLYATTEQVNQTLQEEVHSIRTEVEEETALLDRLQESTHKISEDLEQAQLRLSQAEKLASLGQLIVGVSDLIAAPARAIGTAANNIEVNLADFENMAKDELADDELAGVVRDVGSIRQMLGYIAKGGASIVRLNAALLNYSRGVDEQFADVSIEELIEDTCLVVHGRIRRHRLELKIEPGIVAHCCRGQIERVIGNLLTNASDAIGGEGEDAGEPGIIRISADSVNDDTQIRVVVEDSGPGIPTELTDAVMRPFYTTKSPARGTGLGLYICRGIVKGHKGDLSLGRSASLSGAAVTFTLPVGHLAGHI